MVLEATCLLLCKGNAWTIVPKLFLTSIAPNLRNWVREPQIGGEEHKLEGKRAQGFEKLTDHRLTLLCVRGHEHQKRKD